MRVLLGVLTALALLPIAEAFAQTRVEGYTRRDGTYVAPHYRSTPDRSYNNNWSVSPNTNPYTGRQGTRSPTLNDRPPPSPSYGSPYGSGNRNSNPYGVYGR